MGGGREVTRCIENFQNPCRLLNEEDVGNGTETETLAEASNAKHILPTLHYEPTHVAS
jgi:hypothetical protein